jgi:NADPH:quinone reductase-like Zn-dependent oxidoreductase
VLRVDDVPDPHAGSGEIRVAVRAAGVNPIDWKVRSGAMAQGDAPDEPTIPGSDVAGVVDEVGDGVSDVAVGDEVFGFALGGAAAEYARMAHYAQKPAGMSWEEAAALPVGVETSVRVLDALGIESGQTVVVNGAAGGVGAFAVQFARARGARVIGTASERNHEFLRSLGAEPVTYGEGVAERVRALAPDGVDGVFDAAGQGPLDELIEIAGGPENVVTIADFGAPEKGVRVSTGGGDRAWHALDEAARLYEDGGLIVPIERTFTYAEAGEAQRLSQEGHVRGKLVLLPG